jgi:hypothetical protein
MSVETTAETMRSYLEVFLGRGDFTDYFTDDVTWTTIGTQQTMQGRLHDFLSWMHTQAFDAHPKIKTLVVGDGQVVLEADFVGTQHRRVPRHPGHREVGPGALLRGLRPTGRQARGPARLHPPGPVHPTTGVTESAGGPFMTFGPWLGNRVLRGADSRYFDQLPRPQHGDQKVRPARSTPLPSAMTWRLAV